MKKTIKKIGKILLDNLGNIGLILFALTIIYLCLWIGIQERNEKQQQQTTIQQVK